MVKVIVSSKTKKVLFNGKGAVFIENGIRKAFKQIGELIVEETQKGLDSPPKTGRQYGNHRASKARIEYPANKTGNLRKSLNFKVKGRRRMIVGISNKAPYADFLENGSPNGKIEKRKLLGFTIGVNRNKIRDIFRKNINSEIK